MNKEKILQKFAKMGITEDWLLSNFKSELEKTKSDESTFNLTIYGGDDEDQKKLASVVFKKSFIENRVSFVSEGETIPENTDLIWCLRSYPEKSYVPCCIVNGLSQDGLKTLLDWSIKNLNKKERTELVKYQIVDFDKKDPYVRKMVAQHCTAAFAVGAIPMKAANAPLLVLNEITIMTRIFKFYGLESVDEILKIINLDSLLGALLTHLGRFISGGLLSKIGDVGGAKGKLISSAIYGGTATVVTLAFSVTVSKTIKLACKAKAKQIPEVKFFTNSEDLSSAIVGTSVQCIEDGKYEEKDYEDYDVTVETLMGNIEKGNKLFQEFLDKNTELDNQFQNQQIESEKLSSDMWDAINKI